MQIVGRKAGDAARGFRRIERLVEVDHQRDVGAEQGAYALDHAFVIGGVAVAALDLDAAKALSSERRSAFSSATGSTTP